MFNQVFLKILDNLDWLFGYVFFVVWVKWIIINILIDDFCKNWKVKELIVFIFIYDLLEVQGGVDYNEVDKQFDVE